MRNLRSYPFNSMTRFLNSTDKSSGSNADGSVGVIANTLDGGGDVGLVVISLGGDNGRGEGVRLSIITLDDNDDGDRCGGVGMVIEIEVVVVIGIEVRVVIEVKVLNLLLFPLPF